MTNSSIKKLSPEVREARAELRRKGWSKADVAQRLGLSRIHVSYVLNGHRTSRRLLAAIAALPENPDPA